MYRGKEPGYMINRVAAAYMIIMIVRGRACLSRQNECVCV